MDSTERDTLRSKQLNYCINLLRLRPTLISDMRQNAWCCDGFFDIGGVLRLLRRTRPYPESVLLMVDIPARRRRFRRDGIRHAKEATIATLLTFES
jgi:hypothetical protein